MERSAQEIREEMARILGVPVSDNIENIDEHGIEYGLDDEGLDRIEELRRELEEAIRAGRLEPQPSNEQDENQPDPEPEPVKTPEQLAEERFDNFTTLMDNIRNADGMSDQRQAEIDSRRQELRNETRPVVVEELREEVANLEKDKIEFDEMTRAALENARKEATEMQQESEKAYNDKLVEFLNRKNTIERKLKAMRERGLTPEKLAIAERSAQKAFDDLNREMSDYQAKHFERRSKLDEYIKYIENSIGVKYADVKYEEPEQDNNGNPAPQQTDNGKGNDGEPPVPPVPPAGGEGKGKDGEGDGKDKDVDNGNPPPPAGGDGKGKDDEGDGKDKDGDNGNPPPAGGDGKGKDDEGDGKDKDGNNGNPPPPAGGDGKGKDGEGDGKDKDGDNGNPPTPPVPPVGGDGKGKDDDDDKGKGKDNPPQKPEYKVGKVRGFFLNVVQAILKKIKNPDGVLGRFFGGIESTLLLGAQETLPTGKPEETKTPNPTKAAEPTKNPDSSKAPEQEDDIEKLATLDDCEWARDQLKKLTDSQMDKNSLIYKIMEDEYRKLVSENSKLAEQGQDKADEHLQKMIEELEIPIVEKEGKDTEFQNVLYYRISQKVLDMAEEKGVSLEDAQGDRVIDDIYEDLEKIHLQEKTNEASRQAAENQQQGDEQKPKQPEGKEAPTDDQEK